jgi:hypothetical protein
MAFRLTGKQAWIAMITLVIVVLSIWSWQFFIGGNGNKHAFKQMVSPDKNYRLMIFIGDTFKYAPNAFEIQLRKMKDRKLILFLKTELGKPGIAIDEKRLSVKWLSNDLAEVCLKSEGRKPESVSIIIKPRIQIVSQQKCSQ